jgi:aminoglycoside phosphotransferase (APT) family kinase protein
MDIAGEQRLEAWLRRQPALGAGCRITQLTSPKTGFSADTLLVELAGCGDGTGERAVVVRVEHPGRDTFLGASIEKQARMIGGLHAAGVRAPALVGWEADPAAIGAAFLVTERVPARSLPQHPSYHVAGLLQELSEPRRRAAWEDALGVIASINRLDWRKDFEFLVDPAYGAPGLPAYRAWLRAWRDMACGGRPHPIIDAALDRLARDEPADAPAELLWGDANPGNFLFNEDGSVAVVLDFEASAIGPAEIDLAWWFFLDEMLAAGNPLPAGMPDAAEQVAIYAAALGRPVGDLGYYRILSGVRMSLVMAQTVRNLIADGKLPPDNNAGLANPASAMLATMIGLEPPADLSGYWEMVRVMNDR